jgi:hypothetical protein
MNLRAKFVGSMGLLGLLCLMLPSLLRADTVYAYIGNPYTACFGVYCSGGPYALSTTFDVKSGTRLDNLTLYGPGSNITADVTTFSFTDGTGLILNQPNAAYVSFLVGTDVLGDITAWDIEVDSYDAFGSPYYQANSFLLPNGYAFDSTLWYYDFPYGFSGFGQNFSNPGHWSSTVTPTPEPTSHLLVGTGLLGLLALAARSR